MNTLVQKVCFMIFLLVAFDIHAAEKVMCDNLTNQHKVLPNFLKNYAWGSWTLRAWEQDPKFLRTQLFEFTKKDDCLGYWEQLLSITTEPMKSDLNMIYEKQVYENRFLEICPSGRVSFLKEQLSEPVVYLQCPNKEWTLAKTIKKDNYRIQVSLSVKKEPKKEDLKNSLNEINNLSSFLKQTF